MKWRNVARFRQVAPIQTEQRLAAAYNGLFGKEGEDAEIALADLAAFTGFYQVEPPGADLSPYQAGYNAGLRAAFGRIFHFLSLSDDHLRALEIAARQESEQIY